MLSIMGKSGYTSLSIQDERYARMRRTFNTVVKTESTYTKWHCDVVESALGRLKFLKSTFPNLSMIKIIPHGIVIDDSETGDVVKVTVNGKNIVCSEEKNSEKYIQYALMHPELNT